MSQHFQRLLHVLAAPSRWDSRDAVAAGPGQARPPDDGQPRAPPPRAVRPGDAGRYRAQLPPAAAGDVAQLPARHGAQAAIHRRGGQGGVPLRPRHAAHLHRRGAPLRDHPHASHAGRAPGSQVWPRDKSDPQNVTTPTALGESKEGECEA